MAGNKEMLLSPLVFNFALEYAIRRVQVQWNLDMLFFKGMEETKR
jgi:hypothetical protein